MKAWRLLLLLLVLAPGLARAGLFSHGDLLSERGALFEDGRLTLAEVQTRRFTPYTGPVPHADRESVIWLRLVAPAQPGRTTAVLLMQPATLSEVTLYALDDAGQWQAQHTGSIYPYSERPRTDLGLTLTAPLNPTQPSVYYVRVTTPTGVVHAELRTPESVVLVETRAHTVLGLYFGLTIVMLLLATTMWWSTREPLWGWAALLDLAMTLQSSMATGFFSMYLMPEVKGIFPTLFTLVATLSVTVGGIVGSKLNQALQTPRWVVRGPLVVLPLFVVWVVLIALGKLGTVLSQGNLTILFLALWNIPALLLLGTEDRLLRRIFGVFACVELGYMLLWILPLSKLGDVSTLSLYPTLLGNLFSMTMLMLLVSRRTYLMLQSRQQLAMEKREAEHRYQLEQQHHAETSGMLGMIMHEMKNPLASIRMASELLSSGRVPDADQTRRFDNIQSAVDSIDTVLNRCMDVDRLEKGALSEDRQTEDVVELLQHWLAHHRQSDRLAVSLPDSLRASLDSRLMLLMVGNLVDNALKYSAEKSPVTLSLTGDTQGLTFEVRNRVGRAGFPDPERLFQKYYRSTNAQHASGTGLGLYWVQTVAQRIGGQVRYTRDGEDVVFSLRMPAYDTP